MKTIGIIGGMGPLATADLYQKITLNTKASTDQDHIHIIIDSNTAIPDRTTYILHGGENPVYPLIESARKLEMVGADFLIMPCNTAHYFFDEISEATTIPILNMLHVCADYAEKYGDKNSAIGLLATEGTIRSGIYDQYFKKTGLKLIKPTLYQEEVMDFIYNGIKNNRYNYNRERLMLAIDELRDHGASMFILGCTELSAAESYASFGPGFLDPLTLIARESIVFAGGELNKEKR